MIVFQLDLLFGYLFYEKKTHADLSNFSRDFILSDLQLGITVVDLMRTKYVL